MNLPKNKKVFFASRFRLHVVAHWARSIVFAPNLVEAVKEVLVMLCFIRALCGFWCKRVHMQNVIQKSHTEEIFLSMFRFEGRLVPLVYVLKSTNIDSRCLGQKICSAGIAMLTSSHHPPRHKSHNL